jgi:hypothetical protein
MEKAVMAPGQVGEKLSVLKGPFINSKGKWQEKSVWSL